MKAIFFYPRKRKPTTGGHLYDDAFYEAMQQAAAADSGLCVGRVYGAKSATLLQKMAAPLRNMLKDADNGGLQHGDLAIFNSSTFCYFLPLISRLRRRGVRVMVIHHHFLNEQTRGWRHGIYKQLEYRMLSGADHVITTGAYIADRVRKLTDRDAIICQIPFDKPDKSIGLAPQRGRLLFVGNIEPRKGLHYLIEAMHLCEQRNPELSLSLDIVGNFSDEAYSKKLKSKIADYGLRVNFDGYMTKREISQLSAQCDVFAFPSLLEGYGMALNEAMSMGLPVVCFDNTAMPYSVKTGYNGIVVSTGQVEQFAAALADVCTDDTLRARLSAGALEHAASLSDADGFRRRVGEILAGLRLTSAK